MTTWPPRRVRVGGTSGAGKTTYARQLGRALGVPHRELDEVFWAADWTHRDVEEARADLREFAAGPGWVVDGNWETARAGLMDDADLVVWLDYSRTVVMTRVVRRTLRRLLTREELWHGNREDWRFMLRRDPDENIVLWAWHSYADNRARYLALQAAGGVPVVRLRTPRAARAWLRGLR